MQHHNHLVFEQVLPYAAEGHDFAYASWVAARGLNSLVLAEEPAPEV